MKQLAPRQKEVYEFIKEFISLNGYSPTYREVAKELNIALKGVFDHIMAIQKKGYLTVTHNKARTIKITKPEEI